MVSIGGQFEGKIIVNDIQVYDGSYTTQNGRKIQLGPLSTYGSASTTAELYTVILDDHTFAFQLDQFIFVDPDPIMVRTAIPVSLSLLLYWSTIISQAKELLSW